MNQQAWPVLPLAEWLPTYQTLHRWTQIVGKTRLGLAPFENHWWHGALYVSTRGLTTSPTPYNGGLVEIEFDFVHDQLEVRTSDDEARNIQLQNLSVADFYHEFRELLAALDIDVRIIPTPNELPDALPFPRDHVHTTYDGGAARRCWHALINANRALKRFRSDFAGKCSPTHFWWGGFDLACTRFSGRRAPVYQNVVPNTPAFVMREAYSHECISAGWWPGTPESPIAEPAFYAYAYPEPAGCEVAPIRPAGAFFERDMRLWILTDDTARRSNDPGAMIAEFLESTYEAAAALSNWDVAALRSNRAVVTHEPSKAS